MCYYGDAMIAGELSCQITGQQISCASTWRLIREPGYMPRLNPRLLSSHQRWAQTTTCNMIFCLLAGLEPNHTWLNWGSSIGFSECGISIIWSSVFGILKRNRSSIGARFGIESMRGRCDTKDNLRNDGITRNFGSGLRVWRALWWCFCKVDFK